MNFYGWFPFVHQAFLCFHVFFFVVVLSITFQACNSPWGHFTTQLFIAWPLVVARLCLMYVI